MIRLIFVLSTVIGLYACSSPMTKPVVGYPVNLGEVGPVHPDNPRQQPFACVTDKAGIGAPLVDNHSEIGQPIKGRFLLFPYTKGYSENCGVGMRVEYFYRATDEAFYPLSQAAPLPDDISYVSVNGVRTPFVVRFERGVINRFIYGITMLVEPGEQPDQPTTDLWNHRLLFLFHGGVGIGRHQAGGTALSALGIKASGRSRLDNLFNVRMLSRGYAIMASSGTATDTSFHLPLLAQTAGMLKRQFESRYGKPEVTLGFGGSGGAIQQFYNAQAQPGLLDGMIVSHLFPDLLTQINGVGDCELLEYYFDRGHAKDGQLDPFWKQWKNRSMVEGFHAIDGYKSRLSVDGTGRPMMSTAEPGSSVCVEGWHAMTQLVFNPHFFLPYLGYYDNFLLKKPEVLKHTRWTHWDDGVQVYGKDESGYARRTYDNVGVQYGLEALMAGTLSAERFLHLNARVGGWLPSAQMKLEMAPYYPYGVLALDNIALWDFVYGNVALTDAGTFVSGMRNVVTLVPDERFSPLMQWVKRWLGLDDAQSIWSHQNTTASLPSTIAPRAKADVLALERAYQANLVFEGRMPLPTISILPYLEEQLNIHDARQPFIVRERMRLAGENDRQFSIWGVMPNSDEANNSDHLDEVMVRAVGEMERWVETGRKPEGAEDACWNSQNQLIARGREVWVGANPAAKSQSEDGVCTRVFPVHQNPRVAAGEPFASNVLKCALKPIHTALGDGTYGDVHFTDEQKRYLERIFPNGVCQYRIPARLVGPVL